MVLVIIALIIGGILAGEDIIAAARMQKLMKQVEQYNAAVLAFEAKYGCLPGDCYNATSFWPADAACSGALLCVRPYMATSNGKVCNGNGDGQIIGDYGCEHYLFWEELSLAGLIAGSYSGTCGYDGNCSDQGWTPGKVDAPASPLGDNTIITIRNPDVEANGLVWFWPVTPPGMPARHVFWLGSFTNTDGSGNPIWDQGWPGAVISAKDALALDTKFDDGYPSTGTIIDGFEVHTNSCENAAATPPVYLNTNTLDSSYGCALMFKASF